MIKSVKITSGYPTDIKNFERTESILANKLITFTPGLNVLFGPNMCGKSTILKTITAHGLTKAAWSNLDYKFLEVSIFGEEKSTIDSYFKKQLGFTAEVSSDGPVFLFNDVDEFNQKSTKGVGFGQGLIEYKKGALLKMDSFKQSSGEIEMSRQYIMLESLYQGKIAFNPKKFMSVYNKRKLLNGMDYLDELLSYAKKTVLKGGKPTLVLDEPEKHLSFEYAEGLFSGLLPQLVDAGYQIILASHFMLLPFMKNYNIIWLDRNKDTYINTIKKYVTSKTED